MIVEHKKAKGVNENVVAKTNYCEYKEVLLNNKCFMHSMNRIQSKIQKIGSYESTKFLYHDLMIKCVS